MISLQKDFFVVMSKHANKDFYVNHKNILPKEYKKDLDLNELRKLYLQLLEVETIYYNIQDDGRYNKAKLIGLKQKIDSLKSVISRLEQKEMNKE